MRLLKLGKRQFAFDLAWEDSFGDDPRESAREALRDDEQGLYTVAKLGGMEVLGYGAGSPKGAVFSYAEALAKAGRNGIYVAPAGEGRYWYAIVNDGQLVPGTDRSFREMEAIEAIRTLMRTFDLPIYSVDDLIPEAKQFDLASAVEKVRVKRMKPIGKEESQLAGIAVLLVVVAAIAFGTWYTFFRKPDAAVDQAAQAAQQRAAYIASAQADWSAVPTDSGWAADAFRRSAVHFQSALAGWVLDGVTCQPGTCTAAYSLPEDAVSYAVTPVYERYGREAVTVLPDQRSMTVNLALDLSPSAPVSEGDVVTPALTRARLADTVGRLGMRFAFVTVDGKPVTEALSAKLSAPVGMPPLYRDIVATKHDSELDLVMLRALSSFMAESSFVPTSLTYSMGLGAVPAAWRVEWVRVHGGEV